MKLSTLLQPRLIRCGLAAKSKEEALDEVVGLVAAESPGLTPQELRAALAEREKLGPFSMSKGSAVPHARTEKVADFRIAIGTAPRGIDFKAPDGNPIRVVVLFVIPKKHSNLYLHTLAQFLNLLGSDENLQRVAQAATPEEIIAAVDALSDRPPAAPPMHGASSVTGSAPLSRAVEAILNHKLEALPVVDAEGNLVGEVTSASILQLGVREHFLHLASTASLRPAEPFEAALRAHAETSLEALGVVSTNGFRTVQEDEPLVETAVKLSHSGARSAYVLRGRKLVGLVTAADVLRRMGGGR
jgi:mannitol/fructose-specific phosphotransferase system IIA component (Ntr-type)/predicted transcriptional regulator